MKKLLSLMAVIFCCITIQAQTRSLKDIIGKWQMTGNFGSLEFLDSTRVETIMQGRKVASGTYVMDFTKTPIWLDVTIKQGGKSVTLKQIVEFIDDNTIRWQTSNSNERPAAFAQTIYGAPLTLTRQK